MAKQTGEQGQENRTAPVPRPAPSYPEPEVRRWPHPIRSIQLSAEPEDPLHYIRCSLSYQNQLLADIKSLLEHLTVDTVSEQAEK